MKKLFVTFIGILFVVTTYAQPSEGPGFYRVVNGNSTDQCLKFVDDRISAQQIVGSASSVNNDNGVAAIGRVQNELNDDIKLVNVNTSLTDPGTIIFLDQKTLKNYDIISQGVGLVYISHCVFHGTLAGYIEVAGMPATITKVVNNNDVNLNLYTAHIRMQMYTVDQTRFLGAASNKLALTEVSNNDPSAAPSTCQWYLRKINENSADNYFAAAPVASFTQNGKYYTTLRTAFSYDIPSGSKVKVYKVNEALVEGELVNLEELTGTIPPGLPVIIESSSVNSTDNKLKPVEPFINAVSNYIESGSWWSITRTTSITGLDGIQNSPYLYNNYGWHSHDYDSYSSTHQSESVFSGWKAQGDGIGFFATKGYTGSTPLYKLSIKDGAVGFWEQVANGEKISGNEAYSPVQCQLFPVEKELADIGAQDISYKVTNPLIVAYEYVKDNGNRVIYAKDNNGKPQQSPSAGEIDFMKLHYADNTYHDHSNWVAIETGATPSVRPGDSRIEVTGKVLESSPNLRMKASLFEEIDQNGDFNPNTYCIVNFMDKSYHSTANTNYFFAAPQANEIADIIWAQWDGNDTFIVPPHSGFTGGIKVDFSMYEGELPVLQDEHEYSFRGLIEKLEPSANAIASKDVETISSLYKVYPLNNLVDMEDIATGVTNNVATSKVVSVKYYNVMGVASDKPFEGVNIVVTTYDNGIRTTSKILK